MTIKFKLLGLFGGILISILCLDIYIAYFYKQSSQELEQIHALAEQRVAQTLTAQVNFKTQVQEWKNILLRGLEPGQFDKYLSQFINEETYTRNAALELQDDLPPNNEERKLIEKFLRSHTLMGARYREALTAFHVAEHDPAITVDKYVRGIDREPTETLNELVKLVEKNKYQQLDAIKIERKRIEVNLVIVTVVGFVALSIFLFYAIKNTLLMPIKKLSKATLKISSGDLDYRVDLIGNDEFSELGSEFNQMAAKLDLAQQNVKQSNAHIRGIFNTVNEGIITMDAEGRIIDCNPAAEKIFGYATIKIQAMNFTDLLSIEYRSKYKNYISKYKKNGAVEILGNGPYELNGLHKNGNLLPIEVSINEMDSIGEKLFVGVIRDVSLRNEQQQKLHQMANFDSLTGLPNRSLFKDRLQHAMQLALRMKWLLPVMLVDLDLFKRINDTLGYAAGDEILKQVATRLQDLVRSSDTIARLGGDEFIILLENIKCIDHVEMMVGNLIETMNKPYHVNNHEVYITASVGIAIFPFESGDVNYLLKSVDIAMYKAKELGRNRFEFYSVNMNKFAMDRLDMESKLRNAIKNREFVLHYQPQVNLQTGKIIGVEALLRWEQPGKGLVPPLQFLSLLEETGLIVPVGEQILEMAFDQARCWQEMGFEDIKISVNLSARQFDDHQLVDKINSILSNSSIVSRYIELEVTESAIMQDASISKEKLQALANSGFSIAIDDFGTGYSSLAYLKQFPVDILKIDRSFVMDLEHQNDDRAIAHAIINLAQALNLRVIAEGVENESQLRILAELGCDIIQGYYFSKPLSADNMTGLLITGQSLDVINLKKSWDQVC